MRATRSGLSFFCDLLMQWRCNREWRATQDPQSVQRIKTPSPDYRRHHTAIAVSKDVQKQSNHRLIILRDHSQMRMMIWIVGLLALATSLDSSLYGGLYTRGFVRMLSDMAIGFGFG